MESKLILNMKRILLLALAGISLAGGAQTHDGGYPITPVPFTSVKVTDSFWGQRLKASREVTIPKRLGDMKTLQKRLIPVTIIRLKVSRLMTRMCIKQSRGQAIRCRLTLIRSWTSISIAY